MPFKNKMFNPFARDTYETFTEFNIDKSYKPKFDFKGKSNA